MTTCLIKIFAFKTKDGTPPNCGIRAKYPGVILNSKLTYKLHMEHATNKAPRAFGPSEECLVRREEPCFGSEGSQPATAAAAATAAASYQAGAAGTITTGGSGVRGLNAVRTPQLTPVEPSDTTRRSQQVDHQTSQAANQSSPPVYRRASKIISLAYTNKTPKKRGREKSFEPDNIKEREGASRLIAPSMPTAIACHKSQ
ncbi:hypothetical protein Trydic_g15112 [Trypoxylus dichotomus]